MTSEQLNTALKMELINYHSTNELTDDLRRLILEAIMVVSKEKKYEKLPDGVKIYCEARAYEDCCRHAVHFNLNNSNNALTFINTMIRSSFAMMLDKHLPSSIVETIEF